MAEKERAERFATRPQVVGEELLEPVLRFLQEAGISEDEALRAFRRAWKRSSRSRRVRVSLESLEDPQPFVEIISSWSRNSTFLDKEGRPRDLAVRGKYGFAALVRAAAPQLAVKTALAQLKSYGNVAQLPNGAVRLTKPFFHIKSDRRLAFEPSVRFLLDAATNVRASLAPTTTTNRARSNSHHFWRVVDAKRLPNGRRQEFLAFAKTLSLSFLQDVDDWLSENGVSRSKRTKSSRVGLGLFTIGIEPE